MGSYRYDLPLPRPPHPPLPLPPLPLPPLPPLLPPYDIRSSALFTKGFWKPPPPRPLLAALLLEPFRAAGRFPPAAVVPEGTADFTASFQERLIFLSPMNDGEALCSGCVMARILLQVFSPVVAFCFSILIFSFTSSDADAILLFCSSIPWVSFFIVALDSSSTQVNLSVKSLKYSEKSSPILSEGWPVIIL
uniref:Uncharacterized protein n=1 Tax=Opuntia streptacantha TaxID=393608 RepID=A0A7C9D5Z0_OPUST